MTLEDSQHDSADETVEELTAYLDGELDEAAQAAVEARLSSDPQYLAELQSLQQAWETLEILTPVDAGKSFTQTTMEMVIQDVKASQSRRTFSWSGWIAGLLLLTLGGGLFAAGYSYQRASQQRPDNLLIEHLPAIQDHEVFQSINLDLRMLEQLNHHSLFPHLNYDPNKSFESPAAPEAGSASVTTEQVLDGRRQWLEDLDVEQKAGLKEKLDRFLALEDDKQQAIIDFEKTLAQHPLHEELDFVLNEYYYWLKSLDPGERSRLQDLPPEEFLAAVQKLRASAQREDARRIFEQAALSLPNKNDADYIFNWYQILISTKEDMVRDRFPTIYNQYRERKKQPPLPVGEIRKKFDRRELSLIAKFLMQKDPDFETKIVENSELDLLIEGLTIETRELLYSMPEQMRHETIFAWLESINEIYSRTFRVSNPELRRFTESLPESERDALNRLPIREYMPRLMELFRKKNSSLPDSR